ERQPVTATHARTTTTRQQALPIPRLAPNRAGLPPYRRIAPLIASEQPRSRLPRLELARSRRRTAAGRWKALRRGPAARRSPTQSLSVLAGPILPAPRARPAPSR